MDSSDAIFYIGASHTICQDFAIVNKDIQSPFAIVADGCSGSENSDIGARLLTLAARQLIKEINEDSFRFRVIATAMGFLNAMNLDSTSLDATLLIASATNKNIRIKVFGDGAIAMRSRKTGNYTIIQIEFPSGYPFYLSYLESPSRMKQFLNEKQGMTTNLFWMIPDGNFFKKHEENPDKESSIVPKSIDAHESYYIDIISSRDDCDLVILMSDGAFAFYERTKNETSISHKIITLPDILRNILAFKGTRGNFMTRRANRFMKDSQKQSWFNFDDVSFAAMALDPPEE